jgi:hypothetical protein
MSAVFRNLPGTNIGVVMYGSYAGQRTRLLRGHPLRTWPPRSGRWRRAGAVWWAAKGPSAAHDERLRPWARTVQSASPRPRSPSRG